MGPMTMTEVVQTAGSNRARYLDLLSRLLLSDHSSSNAPAYVLRALSDCDADQVSRFLAFADIHHVLVRAVETLENSTVDGIDPRLSNPRLLDHCGAALLQEQRRISHALRKLASVCDALENEGCPAIVIKSLDHWPDIGSDLDLYTSGRDEQVVKVLKQTFGAEVLPRSWGDRLAHKWNFKLPGLPEAIEVHVGRLGQTGEHVDLAHRVTNYAVRRTVAGHTFLVPAPQERVLVTTLQRMYRHFYCRLCDIVDTSRLIQSQQLDYVVLQAGAEASGIWPGVAAFLTTVADYVRGYGVELDLPAEVISTAAQGETLQLRGDFLRISIVPKAANLFFRQMLNASAQGNVRTVGRLSLLPGLAAAAFVAYKITGNDKGIW